MGGGRIGAAERKGLMRNGQVHILNRTCLYEAVGDKKNAVSKKFSCITRDRVRAALVRAEEEAEGIPELERARREEPRNLKR